MFKDKKIMYKDLMNKDEIFNGPSIQPLNSISAQYTWIKRNVITYRNNEIDFAIYLSGANLVVYNISTDSMSMIPLRNDCTYTSLSFGTSQTGEKLVVVGEKLKPLNYQSENPNFVFVVSPRVFLLLIFR